MKIISIGDVLYDPIKDRIIEVTAFAEDNLGQKALLYIDINGLADLKYVTAWIAFNYFTKLESDVTNAK